MEAKVTQRLAKWQNVQNKWCQFKKIANKIFGKKWQWKKINLTFFKDSHVKKSISFKFLKIVKILN